MESWGGLQSEGTVNAKAIEGALEAQPGGHCEADGVKVGWSRASWVVIRIWASIPREMGAQGWGGVLNLCRKHRIWPRFSLPPKEQTRDTGRSREPSEEVTVMVQVDNSA